MKKVEETIKQLELILKARKEHKILMENTGRTCENCDPDIKALTESIDILSDYKRVLEINKVLLKENEKIKEANDYYSSRYCEISNNSISIQKVKDKIEEINNEKLNYSEDDWYLESEVKGYAIDKLKEIESEE